MKDKFEILYEDNHIIVVVKPFNVLSQSDETNDKDMITMIKNYLKNKYKKPGNVYLGLVHRLDRPASGIMVFARTSKAASRLSEQIRKKEITKKYLAIVNGVLKEKQGVFIDYLEKQNNKKSIVTTKEFGKEAVLNYKILSEKSGLSLVEIDLLTGRHHQIRVQFASRGHSLYGDQKYGVEDKKQLALFAYCLKFVHPVTKEIKEFIKYPEPVGIWAIFK